MDSDDLHQLSQDLITTSARLVRWTSKDSEIDLSLSAARLLARLYDGGATRISDLALAERCSQPTITNHVKRLEAADFVGRAVDPTDGRAWIITLTPRGEEQLAELRDSLGTSLNPYLDQMSVEDQRALRAGVDAMRRLMTLHP